MTSLGWPDVVARLHDTLSRCDHDTDLELAAGPRRLHLMVRRNRVRGICPAYDERHLAELGWQAPRSAGDWWHETPRTPEGLRWWSGFVARTAAAVLTTEPDALSCQILPPTGPRVRPRPTLPRSPRPRPQVAAPPVRPVAAPAPRPPAGPAVPVAPPAAPPPPPVPAVPQPPAGDRPERSGPAATSAHRPADGTAPTADAPDEPGRAAATGTGPHADEGAGSFPTAASGTGLTADDRDRSALTGSGPTVGGGSAEGGRTVQDLLGDAVARRDLPAYLGVLAASMVCVPLAAEPGPDRDVPWTVVADAAGAPLLPVFTTPDALAAFAGSGVPFVAMPCADLLADWPEPAWGLAVDAGTPRTLLLAPPALAALLAANPPVDGAPLD
ncbi:SseB family protein [Micromonospora sp. NPDC047730]|uniref:SseB family protein n=1 Tax=Micromonospora sp. NPDC047730 TaxID=3364253 RepID=UPI00371828A3